MWFKQYQTILNQALMVYTNHLTGDFSDYTSSHLIICFQHSELVSEADGIAEKLIPHKTFTGDRPSLSGQPRDDWDVTFLGFWGQMGMRFP